MTKELLSLRMVLKARLQCRVETELAERVGRPYTWLMLMPYPR